MSALAQFCRWEGLTVTGSDRSRHSPETAAIADGLSALGCTIYGQDGTGISDTTAMVCISTAIEQDNPDIAAAAARNLPVVHRSDVLAALVAKYRTIAVAGTSGKSTVTAMVFEFLSACGKNPSLISGAAIRRLERQGLIGNAFHGTSDILVVEADESDGTIVKYEPEVCLLLNISKDHKSTEEVTEMFARLARQSKISIRNADDRLLDSITTTRSFSLYAPSDWRADTVSAGRDHCTLVRNAVEYHLPLRGTHNLSNCAAALAVAELFNCTPDALARATPAFEGVDRRFVVTETVTGVIVVDDFAHNPEKIKAAVTAARTLAPRIFALFQPHGFGPTRFLRNEYRELFPRLFFDHDVLCLLPIYYAGGTATRDISSADLKADLGDTTFKVIAPDKRDDLLPFLAKHAQAGDCIIVMGARDPSLPFFTNRIAELFSVPKKAKAI
jgi:UDP-N-acetylmuramate--alanine ligase